jgi:hypothetical protein
MAEKKPEDEGILFSGKCLNDADKGKEFEGVIKFKPPAKKPEKKRSIFDSIWVWFLVGLGINFVVGDPIGFTKLDSDQEGCKNRVLPKSESNNYSLYDHSEDCSL